MYFLFFKKYKGNKTNVGASVILAIVSCEELQTQRYSLNRVDGNNRRSVNAAAAECVRKMKRPWGAHHAGYAQLNSEALP